jgi:hypothetical protein
LLADAAASRLKARRVSGRRPSASMLALLLVPGAGGISDGAEGMPLTPARMLPLRCRLTAGAVVVVAAAVVAAADALLPRFVAAAAAAAGADAPLPAQALALASFWVLAAAAAAVCSDRLPVGSPATGTLLATF